MIDIQLFFDKLVEEQKRENNEEVRKYLDDSYITTGKWEHFR